MPGTEPQEAPGGAKHEGPPLLARKQPHTFGSPSPIKVPSVRMVKGESPGRRAENWPPRDVIRKQSEKKPMPRTKSLRRATGQVSGMHP